MDDILRCTYIEPEDPGYNGGKEASSSARTQTSTEDQTRTESISQN